MAEIALFEIIAENVPSSFFCVVVIVLPSETFSVLEIDVLSVMAFPYESKS